MYRLIYVFAILSVAAAHWGDVHHPHCSHHHHHDFKSNAAHKAVYHKRVFDEIANKLIEADKKVQYFCTRHSNGATKETITEDQYILTTPMTGYEETDIEIKVRNKVLYINGFKQSAGLHYAEIRIIPGFVNNKEARYELADGALKIYFPIQTSAGVECTVNLNNDTIIVPKRDPGQGLTGASDRSSED